MKSKLTLVLLFAASITGLSQESKGTPYIEVTGSAEMSLDPNIIVLSVNLREFEENKVKISLESVEKDFLEAISKSGIEKKNISLADLNVNSFTVRKRERETFARRTYELTFSAEKDVLNFLDNVKSVRLESLYISRMSHSEIEKYRLEVKVAALKAAEKKADILLQTAGVKRGKPLIIKEVDENNFLLNRNLMSNSVTWPSQQDSITPENTEMKKIRIRFEILVQYSFE